MGEIYRLSYNYAIEEFLRICKKKYMQECEMRSYFLEGIQIDSEDSAKIEISILTGT